MEMVFISQWVREEYHFRNMKRRTPSRAVLVVAIAIFLLAAFVWWWVVRDGASVGDQSQRGYPDREQREKYGEGVENPEMLGESEANAPSGDPVDIAIFRPAVSVSASGRLTTETIEKLNLTEDEIDSLTNTINAMQEEAAADFVQRTKLVDSRTNGDHYYYNYFTKAREDKGRGLLDSFSQEVEKTIGADRSKIFMAGMEHYEFAGRMGKYDLETELIREGGDAIVKQKYLDPGNGAVVGTVDSLASSFRETFGDLIKIPGGK
ncbi:hypothetical protein [Luteolibacter sp. Populi]|uniref:hypothetical protein n=1 Tax=Luteolibacter sp. Populi TaxID=3230487 RepID=UPI003466CF8E